MSAVFVGPRPTLAALHPGTQALYRWGQWQVRHACKTPLRIGVFRKEDIQLVVYQYGPELCCVLKHADTKPRFQDFREWRQPFAAVQRKLQKRGWTLESDSGEVTHVH